MVFFTTFVGYWKCSTMSNNNDFRKIYEESEKQFLENAQPTDTPADGKTEAKSLLGFILGFIVFILIALGFLYLGTLIQQ